MDGTADWVELRCTWLDEAVWFRAALRAAGIEALIPDEHTLGLPLAPEMDPGTVRLMVRAADVDRAVKVLAANPMPVEQ